MYQQLAMFACTAPADISISTWRSKVIFNVPLTLGGVDCGRDGWWKWVCAMLRIWSRPEWGRWARAVGQVRRGCQDRGDCVTRRWSRAGRTVPVGVLARTWGAGCGWRMSAPTASVWTASSANKPVSHICLFTLNQSRDQASNMMNMKWNAGFQKLQDAAF